MVNKKKIPRMIPRIIEILDLTKNIVELKFYENLLVASFISSLGFVGSIANLIVRLLWKDPIVEIAILSILMMGVAFLLDIIVRSPFSLSVQTHMVSGLVSSYIFIVAAAYYERIGLLVWAVVIVLLAISMTRIDKTMLLYVATSSLILQFYLWMVYPDDTYALNQLHHIVLLVILLVIIVISISVNHIYTQRFINHIQQYNDVLYHQEELTMLNEELVATEEELKTQNEQLLNYNDKIKANEERLNYMAYYDTLTHLPNRKMLMEHLDLMLEISRENHTQFAVVFIDLDSFKKINDTMGHYIGDLFLCEVSNRLSALIHRHDTLGRLGGDEFAIIIQKDLREEILYNYLEKLVECLEEPFEIQGYVVRSSASFGVSIFPEDGKDAAELVKAADTAMYKAKELGKNNVQFFRKEMKEAILHKIELENELIEAFANNEFYLDYQPQYELKPYGIRGFEALIRWKSPRRGIVNPMDFIPLAEEMGLIHDIGEWVIQCACKKIKEIEKIYKKNVYISVNVSTIQIKDTSFVQKVKEILREENIKGESLEFEITESVFIDNIEEASLMIHELKSLGIRIALDDFGTGYSSLSYLKCLPIDTLKIDKSFIWGLNGEKKERQIVGSIISLVHEMNISVVAEGVETDDQLNYLSDKSCDSVQGFLLGRPLSEKDMHDLIKDT